MWMDRAACEGTPHEWWFPENPGRNPNLHRALEFCGKCPVRRQCLNDALEHDAPGVWGGTTERDRVTL